MVFISSPSCIVFIPPPSCVFISSSELWASKLLMVIFIMRISPVPRRVIYVFSRSVDRLRGAREGWLRVDSLERFTNFSVLFYRLLQQKRQVLDSFSC